MKLRLLVFTALISTTGCDRVTRAATELAAPEPVVAAEPIEVICVASRDTTCSESHLSIVLTDALQAGAQRSAKVRLWVSTPENPAAEVAASGVWQIPKRGNDSVKARQRDAWIAGEVARMTALAAPRLQGDHGYDQMLAEAIGAVALKGKPGTVRDIVLVSTGREVNARNGDMDCKAADPKKFRALTTAGPLPPGSLRGVSVSFAFVTREKSSRRGCIVTGKKSRTQDEAWQQAVVTAANASAITFHQGTPELASP